MNPHQPPMPEHYHEMSDSELTKRIAARRAQLSGELLILGHHYQRDDVIQHADLIGDSLQLSRCAAEVARKGGTTYIVF